MALVRDEVVRALREAGLTAFAAWPPERMRDYGGAVAAVDVGTAESGHRGKWAHGLLQLPGADL